MNSFKIGSYDRANSQEVFIIAEIANAHEGNIDKMLLLIKAAAESKVNAVKFQKYTAEELYTEDHPRFNHFKKMEFTTDQWKKIIDYARALGLLVLADVFGVESANLMMKIGVDGFKVHSSDLLNFPLLDFLKHSRLPVLLSCGGSTKIEIAKALSQLQSEGKMSIVLMHGFQAFPTQIEHTELAAIRDLAESFQLPVGFADHIDGEDPMALHLPLMAVASGSALIEKHITLDRAEKGIDYFSSLNPNEFSELVTLIRKAQSAIGSGKFLSHQDEFEYRKKMKKGLVLTKDCKAGDVIENNIVSFNRVESNVNPVGYDFAIGRKITADLPKGSVLRVNDLENKVIICVIGRLKSTRLKQKCLLSLHHDDSVITFLLKRLKRIPLGCKIVLCTSTNPADTLLTEEANKAGVDILFGSEENVMDRMLAAANKYNADWVVRVTGDNPLTDPNHISKLIDYALSNNLDFASSKNLPSGTGAEAIRVKSLDIISHLAEQPELSEYMTWFLDNPSNLSIGNLPIEDKLKRRDIRLTMDHQADYELVKIIVDQLSTSNPDFTVEDVIEFLDKNSDKMRINASVDKGIDRSTINTKLIWSRAF